MALLRTNLSACVCIGSAYFFYLWNVIDFRVNSWTGLIQLCLKLLIFSILEVALDFDCETEPDILLASAQAAYSPKAYHIDRGMSF
jgi:hypothetical protein